MNKQKEKLAILVPYRNRKEHLKVFIPYMNNFMKNNFPKVDYKIVIIEQYDNLSFNRGALLNVGAILSKDYDYFILHDIDYLPISAEYSFRNQTHHLSRIIYEQNNNGKVKYNYCSSNTGNNVVSGALKVSKNDFFNCNGFPNDYWGWGGEDIVFNLRLRNINKPPSFNEKEGYYVTLKHKSNIKKIDERPNHKKSQKQVNDFNNNKLKHENGVDSTSFKIIKTEYNDDYIKYSVLLDTFKKITYKDINGWFSFKNIYDEMINKFDDGVFIEIGAWFGKSTAYMAEQIKNKNKKIKFYAIDTWEGTEGLPVGKIAKELGGNVYNIFEKNMINCEVFDYINVIQESSLTAHNNFKNNSVDFILIDGDHRYEGVISDLNNFYKKLKRGGIIAGDDYDKHSVKKAVDEFCSNNNIELQLRNKTKNNWLIIKK